MANRDVNLVIRARDEAARVINSVAAELDALIGKEVGAAQAGKQFSGSLAEMVSEMAKFEKASGLVAAASDRAETAIARQRASLAETGQQLLAVTAQLENARRAIERGQTAIVDTKLEGGDTTRLVAGLQGATLEVARLEAEQRRLTNTAAAQARTLGEQENAYREVASMANVADAAVKSFGDESERANIRARAATEATTAALREQAAAARESAAAQSANDRFSEFMGVKRPAGDNPKSAAASAEVFQEQARFERSIQDLIDKTDPAAAIQRKLAEDIELARKAMQRGTITAEQFAKAEAELTHQAIEADAALGRVGRGQAGKPSLFGLKPYELTNLGYQVNDVITQLASGTAPLQVIAQQGGQILQLMPKVGGTIVTAFSSPYFLTAAATFGAIALAVKRAGDNARQLEQIEGILSTMGDNAQFTAEELQGVVKTIERIGLTSEQSLQLLRDFVSEGLNPAYLQAFAQAAKDAADATGQDLKSALEDAEKGFSKGYEAVAELDDKLQFLTVSERAQIRAMFESGNAAAAREKAFRLYADKMKEIAEKSKGEWSDAFDKLGNSVDRLLDRFSKTDLIQGFAGALDGAVKGITDAMTSYEDMDREQVDRNITRIENSRRDREARGQKVDGAGDPYLMMAEEGELSTLKARLATLDRIKNVSGDIVDAESAAAQKRRQDRLAEISDEERLAKLRDASTKQQRALSNAEGQERASLAGKLAYQQELNASGDVELANSRRRVAVARELEQVTAQNRQAAQRARAEREREIQQFNSRVIGAEGGAARNPRSSAQGYGQFLEGTWLEQFRKVFAAEAERLSDQQILALRRNQSVAKAIIDNYARENARFLESFGAKVTAGNLYLTHFLGAGDAKKILQANPNSPVDSMLSDAVMKANPEYLRVAGGKGRARTAGELRDFIAGRVGDTGAAQSSGQVAIAELIENAEQAQEKFNLTVKQANDERKRSIDALKIENGLQDSKLIAAQRTAAIAKAEFNLRQQVEDANRNLKPGQDPVKVTEEQIKLTRELAAAEFDLAKARELAQAQTNVVERPVSDLTAERNALQQQADVLRRLGDTAGANALELSIRSVDAELVKAIDSAILFYEALDPDTDPLHRTREQISAIVAQLKTAKAETFEWNRILGISGETIANSISNGAVNAFDQFARAIANGENAVDSLWNAFRSFASNFLLEIAKMIQQQLVFNLVSGIFRAVAGGLAGGFTPGAGITADASATIAANPSIFHTGGVAGLTAAPTRRVSPAWFTNAVRYHSGGIAGLRPDEVPAILQRGEEVLTRGDQRHRDNAAAGANGAVGGLTVVNAVDGTDALEKALRSRRGEKVILNYIRDNAGAVKQALG